MALECHRSIRNMMKWVTFAAYRMVGHASPYYSMGPKRAILWAPYQFYGRDKAPYYL